MQQIKIKQGEAEVSLRKFRRRHKSFSRISIMDPAMRKTLINYAYNFLCRIIPDENILAFSFECLDVKTRARFIDDLFRDEGSYRNVDSDEKTYGNPYLGALEDTGSASGLASTIIRIIYRKDCKFKINDVAKLLAEYLDKENRKISGRFTLLDRRTEDLGNIFRLSDTDLIILKLIYLAFSTCYESLNNIFNNINFSEFSRLASITTGLSPVEIRRSLNKSGMLVSGGLIESIDHTGSNFISLDDSVSEYLAGISEKNIVEKFIKLDKDRKLKTEDFTIPIEDRSLITDILSTGRPCNILLYGVPGTGKTEFARTIASQCSETVYTTRYGEWHGSSNRRRGFDSDSRTIALRIAINTVSENGGILIVDEADFLLNTISYFFDSGRPEKGWLNDLLDNSRARIIWITNKTGEMEESTLRRFSYSLRFKKFDKNQRISVWNNILKRNPLKKIISPELVSELSLKYEVNAGAIASSLNALKNIHVGKKLNSEEVKPLLENMLTKHSVLLNTDIKKKNRLNDLTGKYELSFLNTDTDINTVVSSIKKFTEINNPDKEISNINLLLWGESGTGKTEFAKYLASQTGLGLIIKRSSDLMNMWVGQTEKLIREAFREAEEKRSILFIDEADTFFTSRERARASWEISHTNEFLVQMENFSGILICCTNLLEIFDTAAMRRFNWKVRFSPVLPEKRIPLYEKYFVSGISPLTQKQKKRISAIELLTPGHVKAVNQRRFFADNEIPDYDSIIDDLEKEASYMKIRNPKKVGF